MSIWIAMVLFYSVLLTNLLVIFGGCSGYKRWRNDPPEIYTFTVPKEIGYGETVALRVNVSDPEDDPLTYSWDVSDGVLEVETASEVQWTAPALPDAEVALPQTVLVHVSVRDKGEEAVVESAVILVFQRHTEWRSLSGVDMNSSVRKRQGNLLKNPGQCG